MDMIDIAIAKAFATKVAAGFSKVEVDGMTINFTLNDGTTTSLTVPTPADGVSVTDIDIDENGNLICTMSDGTEIDAGKVTPTKGVDYYTPEEIEEVKEDILTDLQERIDLLTSEYTTITSENSNDMIIENAINYYNQGNIKIGNGPELEQNTTTGKNLLPYPYYDITKTTNGITFTDIGDGSIKIDGTATDSASFFLFGTYGSTNNILDNMKTIISLDASGTTGIIIQAQLTDSNGDKVGGALYGNNLVKSDDISNAVNGYIRIVVQSGQTLNNVIVKPYMVAGNYTAETIPDYEPYTGAYPSPNPDYPQDIHVVEGECGVEVSNKNLFDKNNANILTNIYVASNSLTAADGAKTLYIKCKPNTTYTVSRILGARFAIADTVDLPARYVAVNNKQQNNTSTNLTITTSENAQYLVVFYYLSTADTLTEEEIRNSIQIEMGETANSYIEHKSQTYPITLPEGMFLGKIGTASNYIYGTKDNWKLHNGLIKFVYGGIETGWSKSSNTNVDRFLKSNPNVPLPSGKAVGYNNYFKVLTSGGSSTNIEPGTMYTNDNQYVFNFSSPGTTTLEQFKTWLSTHNTIHYSPLAETTDVSITDTTLISQLNNIADNMQTYKDETIIITTGEGLAPNIQFDYFTNLNERSSNKVINISSESTDEQYPSAKAVYNYIETKLANLNN